MAVRANKPAFNIREKLKELTHSIGLKGRELMSAATVQEARDLVSAGRKNLIINGAMQVWQRGTSLTGLSNGSNAFLADRWKYGEGGTMSAVVTMSQETDVPTGQGFGYSLKVSPTTADASIDANEIQVFAYQIEARDLLQLGYGTPNAKSSTLSFWVKSSQAGTATIWLTVPNAGQSCALQYTVHRSNAWQKIILTIPANTSGTIPNSNASGMTFYWNTAAGTNFTGTGGNDGFWGAQTDTGRAIGQTINYLETTSDYFQITGVQLEVGKNATDFEHRSFGEELALCQRYFYKFRLTTQEWIYNEGNSASNKWHQFYIGHSMRPISGIDVTGVTTGGSIGGLSGTINSYAVYEIPGDTPSRVSSRVTMTQSGGTARNIHHYDGWSSDYIDVNAEL